MTTPRCLWFLIALGAVVMAGCAPLPDAVSTAPSPATAAPAITPPPSITASPPTLPPNPPVGSAPPPVEAVVAQARADLSRRLGVSPDQIATVSVDSREWPDSSLGCPEPGYAYAQVITPGYRVILAYQHQQYDYHADTEGRLVLCPNR